MIVQCWWWYIKASATIQMIYLTLYRFPSFGHFTRIRDPTWIFFMIVALTRDDTRLSSLTDGLDFGLRCDLNERNKKD